MSLEQLLSIEPDKSEATSTAPAPSEDAAEPPPEQPAADAQSTQQPAQPGSEAGKTKTLFDRFRERGIDFSTKYRDEEALVEGLANLARKIGERNEYAELGRFVQERPAEALAWIQSQLQQSQGSPPAAQQQPPQTTSAQQAEVIKLLKTEYDPEWLNQVEYDEQGNLVAKPGAEPGIVPKLLKAQREMRKLQERLLTDPLGTLKPVIEAATKDIIARAERAEQAVRELEARIVNQDSYDIAQSIIEQDKDWMFINGEIKPNNFTKAGRLYAEALIEEGRATPDDLIGAAARAKERVLGRIWLESVQQKQKAAAGNASTSRQPQGNKAAAVRKPQQAPPDTGATEPPAGRSLFDLLMKSVEEHPPESPPWAS
jgi:hypothetical protein